MSTDTRGGDPAAPDTAAATPDLTGTELDQLFRDMPPEDEHEEPVEEGSEEEPHRRKRRRGSHHDKPIRELNLTAMMDMFTIILVFLLKSYATAPERVQVSELLSPPRSTAKIPMDVAITIMITKEAILVDDKAITSLEAGKVRGEAEGAPQQIQPLFELLEAKVAEMKRIEGLGGPPFEGKVLIVADDQTNYALLMRVLYTAGTAQFTQYKLVVRSQSDNQVLSSKEPQ